MRMLCRGASPDVDIDGPLLDADSDIDRTSVEDDVPLDGPALGDSPSSPHGPDGPHMDSPTLPSVRPVADEHMNLFSDTDNDDLAAAIEPVATFVEPAVPLTDAASVTPLGAAAMTPPAAPAPVTPVAAPQPSPDPAPPKKIFLPNAMTIAGLQHIIDNMNKDTHTALSHWDEFFADLGNLQAFFGMRERGMRFVERCLCGTPYEAWSKEFEELNVNLYDARWHEVVSFLEKILPLIPVLRQAFNATKYKADVSGEEEARLAQRTSQFNPDALTRFLQGKGELYGHMILLVEEIPEDLTVWGEACPCHWPLMISLSGDQKKHG